MNGMLAVFLRTMATFGTELTPFPSADVASLRVCTAHVVRLYHDGDDDGRVMLGILCGLEPYLCPHTVLYKAYLRNADIRRVNFSQAYVSMANLREVDLRGTNHLCTLFTEADPSTAHL